MMQVPFYLGLFALGALFNLAVGPRRDGALVAVLGFPCGLALWVISCLAGIALGLPLGQPLGLGLLVVESLLLGAVVASRRRPGRDVLRSIAAWGALFAIGTVVLCSFSVAKFSGDSHQIVRLAHLLGRGAPLDETVVGYLSDRGIFTVVAYAGADVIGMSLLYSMAPVVGLSLAGLFAVGADRIARGAGAQPRPTRILIGLALVGFLSAFNPSYHLVYIHMNQGSALYLLGFFALAWLAEESDEPAWYLWPAFLCLAAFALHRVEAPVFAGLFIVFAFYAGRLPRRAVAPAFAAYTIFMCAWLARFGASAPADSEFLSAGRAAMLVAATAACFVGWLVVTTRPFARLRRFIPALIAGAVVVALVAAFVLKPHHMIRSYDALEANIVGLRSGVWGITWWMVMAMTAVALFLPRLPTGRALVVAVPVAAAITLLLAYGRIPYRIGLGDSANRMFLHYLPLAMTYLVAKFAPHLSERG